MANRKVAIAVKQAVAEIVETEISDPRLSLVTITDVDVSPDTAYATVFYSVIDPDLVSDDARADRGDHVPDAAEVEAGFSSAASRIRSLLGKRLSTRNTPELRFEPDPVTEQAGRVEALLRQLNRPDDPGAVT